jgi:glyoxylase-like metal-dependent hydrolase (beta-lactamase superfamily II)
MQVHELFDRDTHTLTYLVYDVRSGDAVVIDPVLGFEPATGATNTRAADELVALTDDLGLSVYLILETHAHADHVSASPYLRRRLRAPIAIGEHICDVQRTFEARLELPCSPATDGRQFDRLLRDGDVLAAGTLSIEVIATPGHTSACVTYKIDDAIFTGDALFVEDYGVGRCDFPGGSADDLYTSVHDKLYALPDDTRVFVGHDYQPGGRPLRFQTTLGASKRQNVLLRGSTTRDEFVQARRARDARLAPPRLLVESVTRNVFPDLAEANRPGRAP